MQLRANPRKSQANEHHVRELYLTTMSEGRLYPLRKRIETNLRKKFMAGKYDTALAVKAFQYLADAGAKNYEREYGVGEGFGPFTKADREAVAKQFRDDFESEELAAGRWVKRPKRNPRRVRRNASPPIHLREGWGHLKRARKMKARSPEHLEQLAGARAHGLSVMYDTRRTPGHELDADSLLEQVMYEEGRVNPRRKIGTKWRGLRVQDAGSVLNIVNASGKKVADVPIAPWGSKARARAAARAYIKHRRAGKPRRYNPAGSKWWKLQIQGLHGGSQVAWCQGSRPEVEAKAKSLARPSNVKSVVVNGPYKSAPVER